MIIHLHFLQKALLDDSRFLRDYFAQFKNLKHPAIVLHDHISDDVRRVEMTTKRISAYLSEEMVPSAALSAYQRNLYQTEVGVNATQIHSLFKTLRSIVLNGVVKDEQGGYILADIHTILLKLTQALPATPVLFPANPLSPLGQIPMALYTEGAYEKLLQAYSEEADILQLAQTLPGAYMASARSFVTIDG